MRFALFACAFQLCSVMGLAQPAMFHKYIFAVRDHQTPSNIAAFARQCGISGRIEKRFALDGVPVRDLAKAIHKEEKDDFATAELWLADGKPSLVVTWSTDAYLAQEQTSCLDSSGRITKQKIESWSCDGDACDNVVISREINKSGQLTETKALLISPDGAQKPLVKGSLDQESYDFSTHYDDNRSLADFKFPKQLLQLKKSSSHAAP